MEPFEEFENEYENDDDLTPEQNRAFRIVYRKYGFIVRLYYRVVAQLDELKRENAQLREANNTRMSTIEVEQRLQGEKLGNVEKTLGKIESNTTWLVRAVGVGIISGMIGLVTFLIQRGF